MADVVVIPQSRSEEILAATINGEEYNQPPQSRIEWLLLALKDAIEQGGGGGGTTNYDALSNKPLINGVTLSGNKSLADLGIMTEINKVMAMISGTFDATVGYSKDDVVIYDEKLYQFKADHVAGAWDSTEVDQVTIADLLNQSSGSVDTVNGKTGNVVLTASDVGAITSTEKGAADGVATLGNDGKVPSSQLPSMSGGISLKKIWENPDPTAVVSPTDITIPSVASYEKFTMFFKQYRDSNNVSSVTFLKNHQTDMTWVLGGNGGVTIRRRDISFTGDTTLHVGNCKTATGTTAQTNDNNANIPLVLYAVDERAAASGPSLDYNQLINLPTINAQSINGNKTGSDYGVVDEADSLTSAQIDALIAMLS